MLDPLVSTKDISATADSRLQSTPDANNKKVCYRVILSIIRFVLFITALSLTIFFLVAFPHVLRELNVFSGFSLCFSSAGCAVACWRVYKGKNANGTLLVLQSITLLVMLLICFELTQSKYIESDEQNSLYAIVIWPLMLILCSTMVSGSSKFYAYAGYVVGMLAFFCTSFDADLISFRRLFAIAFSAVVWIPWGGGIVQVLTTRKMLRDYIWYGVCLGYTLEISIPSVLAARGEAALVFPIFLLFMAVWIFAIPVALMCIWFYKFALVPEEIAYKLRKADAMICDGREIKDVLWDIGVNEEDYSRWRLQYGWMNDARAIQGEPLQHQDKAI
jgi:hypothetical protein